MKPIKLVISGWGPYKDKEEIDFEGLSKRGTFLITGPTGAGKTTIFDAITYALYGDLSGNLRQKATVRSDFAQVQTQTFVEFTMEHDGRIYQIRRNPEYQRPRRKKGGKESMVAEKENARLTFADGSVLEGNREVNEKIREILRLDLKQFRQISMIAQGEFAQLLHAGGDEKMKIFREIFGTSVYDFFLKKLKERAASQEKRVSEYLHRMEEDVRLFSTEDERFAALTQTAPYPYREIAVLLLTMEKEAAAECEILEQNLTCLEEEIQQAGAELAMAEQLNSRFAQLEKQKLNQQRLAQQREEMDRLEKVCVRGVQAAKVLEVHRQSVQAQADLSRQYSQLESQKQQLRELLQEQESFRPVAEREKQLEQLFERQEVYRQAVQKLNAAETALEKDRLRLAAEQQKYLLAEKTALARQRICETLESARQYSMIGLVAELLEEGKPCPVCGSVEHPRIARCQGGPDEKQVEQAAQQLEEARKAQLKCHGEARAALELCEKQKTETDSAKMAAQDAREKAEQIEGELEDIRKLFDGWPLPDEIRRQIRRFHETQAAAEEKKCSCLQLEETIVFFKTRCAELEKQLSRIKEQQGFEDDDSWMRALMEEKTLEKQQRILTQYKEDVRVCGELLDHLKEELAGKQPIDTTQLRAELEDKQSRKQEMAKELQKQHLLQLSAGRTGRSLTENQKRSGEAQAAYGVVKDLENMASGNNPRRLVFEQYVLAGYFDEILRAANLRLKYMSDGRYELYRAREVSDGRKKDSLEIEVMDYYTGKRRSVRTLSGGETFKASLALALGLSDAVCAASGGVKVDTLFVDEGFGALDAQSLDQACSTLLALAGENRLIGIISHVGELKERIPSQIIVEKETLGSRIRVKV